MTDHIGDCPYCPVPGKPCVLKARGQCHEAEREATLRERCGRCDLPYHRRALEHAGIDPGPDTDSGVEDPPLPSVARQATGFAATAARVMLDGGRRVGNEEKARRLAICGECDHLRKDRRCGKMSGCGCFVDAKVVWRASRCPVGKW